MSATPAVAPFRPPRWLPGGHLQTVVPAFLPHPLEPPSRRVVVEVEPASEARGATSVELWISESAVSPIRGTVLVVHGLCGSARSGDVLRATRRALDHGWHVARVNLRNWGGTEALASTLYNAGQSDDIGHLLAALEAEQLPRPFGVVSFSLGANQVLLHAAETGVGCAADTIVAINPPVDLQAANQAIRRPANALYHLKYIRSLCRLLDQVRAQRPVPGPTVRWWQLRDVRRFDELFTVPDAGHPDVDTYYAAASSGPRLGAITVPSLILSAANDPIVRVDSFEAYRTPAGYPLVFEHPASGGHCGYWSNATPRAWAPSRALAFLEDRVGGGGSRSLIERRS